MDYRKLLVEKELTINAYDIDAMGIVSNIVYVRWFEDMRMDVLNTTYPLRDMMKANVTPILMRTEVDYLMPLTLFDKPIGRCWLVALGKSSWELAFEISVGDTVHCRGRQKGCFYDLQKKKATRMPEPLRRALEERKDEILKNA